MNKEEIKTKEENKQKIEAEDNINNMKEELLERREGRTSEWIEYSGTFTEFESEDVREIKKIVAAFHNARINCETDNEISFEDVLLTKGTESIETVKHYFGEFCKQHPHIKIEITASYIEYTPYDVITIQGDKIKI